MSVRRRIATISLLVATLLLLAPSLSWADNCSGKVDCFGYGRAAAIAVAAIVVLALAWPLLLQAGSALAGAAVSVTEAELLAGAAIASRASLLARAASTARTVIADGRLAQTGSTLARAASAQRQDQVFHYTFNRLLGSIKTNGLKPNAWATPRGTLTPLQAQLDLALPPNRGLPNTVIRIDLSGLRQAGYKIPEVTQVARSYSMPGGGVEMRFPYTIPPRYITVVEP